jgi:hypothetical protein
MNVDTHNWNEEKGLPSLAQISSEGLAEAEDSPISAIDWSESNGFFFVSAVEGFLIWGHIFMYYLCVYINAFIIIYVLYFNTTKLKMVFISVQGKI